MKGHHVNYIYKRKNVFGPIFSFEGIYMVTLRVVYTGYIVAMVTFYVKEMIKTCLSKLGHSFDTIILTSTDIGWQ